MKKTAFEILVRDRDGFEKLLVQVRWGNIVLCELNKERGEDQAEMKLYCNDVLYNDQEIKFPFADFLEAMKVAQKELKRL
ncbi:hypothetical protein AVKW3434_23540 [Acidovorax sp. SUPP3434]|uniref:hypothetical protein n=1 Tax=Acidovorax sp. SUPP3434 TaxID=2920880 RepID=UPI0023DE2964|nr:hypothetical protein [Acidovorax sp. SUPP3434]GKT02419.1 hypothetical protein AVKW3434_23540 [Acidovorax sp. SUPP3434]